MDDCEKYRELISAYIDGMTSEDEAAELLIHMTSCEECSALLDAYTIVNSLFPNEEEAPPELKDSVMAEIHKTNTVRPAKRKRRIIMSTLAAAACLALVLFSLHDSDIIRLDKYDSSPRAAVSYDTADNFISDSPSVNSFKAESPNLQDSEKYDIAKSVSPESPAPQSPEEYDIAESVSPESPAPQSPEEYDITESLSPESPPEANEPDEQNTNEEVTISASADSEIKSSGFGNEYRAVIYMYGTLPDIVSQQGFDSFKIDDGVLGIAIDLDTLEVLEDAAEYEIVYGNEEAGSALVVYTQEQ